MCFLTYKLIISSSVVQNSSKTLLIVDTQSPQVNMMLKCTCHVLFWNFIGLECKLRRSTNDQELKIDLTCISGGDRHFCCDSHWLVWHWCTRAAAVLPFHVQWDLSVSVVGDGAIYSNFMQNTVLYRKAVIHLDFIWGKKRDGKKLLWTELLTTEI